GELSALLLESQEIKDRQPLYNRRLRRLSQLYTIQLDEAEEGLLRPTIVEARNADRARRMYGLFASQAKARAALIEVGRARALCDYVMVTPSPLTGACMSRQLKRCKGLCTEDWSKLHHNTALMDGLSELALKVWPYEGPVALLERQNPQDHLSPFTLFVVDNWCLLATHKGEGEPDVDDLESLSETTLALDRDIYRYLVNVIFKRNERVAIKPLQGHVLNI
ncbi:MAG TPA: hypothetical protein VIC08_07675, partial [Cellvibrionaceae bacterium]